MDTQEKSNNATVGLVIIIIILLIGGVYLWKNSAKERENLENPYPALGDISADVETMGELDANLDNINIEGLDEGL